MDDLEPTPALARLEQAPRSERRAVLEALVADEFRNALLMDAEDVLPLDANYFDLGLTSLRASEVKERLEEQLRCELDTALLFGLSTIRQIADHLAALVLPQEAVPPPAEGAKDHGPAPELHQRVDDLIADLYRS